MSIVITVITSVQFAYFGQQMFLTIPKENKVFNMNYVTEIVVKGERKAIVKASVQDSEQIENFY